MNGHYRMSGSCVFLRWDILTVWKVVQANVSSPIEVGAAFPSGMRVAVWQPAGRTLAQRPWLVGRCLC